jgi:hypothetical protein
MIKAIGYDSVTQTLEIEFKRGKRLYRYFDVPPFLYEGIMVAKSKGHFFMEKIAERFRNEQIF